MVTVEVAAAEPAELGECPVWSVAEQLLYWIDIDGHAVLRYDPGTGRNDRCTLNARPGSMALTAVRDRLLVGLEHEVVWLDWASGEVESFVTLEEANVGIRLNDGRTDPAGRFIVGSMFADTKARRSVGSLHQVSADGSTRLLRPDVGVANGLAFDAERKRMYFADTPTEQIIVWDYDADSGELRNERVFFDYSTIDGKPDGACVDTDGCYWSASVYGWAVIRITPDGDVDRRIELPVHKPSMPAFGGPDMQTLFVTSIGDGDTAGAVASDAGRDGVAAGALLAIDLSNEGITGHPDPPFAGSPPTS